MSEKDQEGLLARLADRRDLAFRWLRRIVLVIVVVMAGLLVRHYDLEGWRPELEALGSSVRKSLVIYAGVDEDTVLGRGSLIEGIGTITYEGSERSGLFVARIEGVPGERIEIRVDKSGARELLVAGRRTWAQLPPDSPLRSGIIPEDHYLALHPVSGVPGFDSRTLGLVPRERIQRKIIASL